MKRKRPILFIALGLAILLSAIAGQTLFYLLNGYSLAVAIHWPAGMVPASSGSRTRVYHVAFPLIRILVHLLLWITALVAAWLFAVGHSRATPVSWLVFAAAILIGMSDVVFWGTMGSPTSRWLLLTLLLLAVASTFRSKLMSEK